MIQVLGCRNLRVFNFIARYSLDSIEGKLPIVEIFSVLNWLYNFRIEVSIPITFLLDISSKRVIHARSSLINLASFSYKAVS